MNIEYLIMITAGEVHIGHVIDDICLRLLKEDFKYCKHMEEYIQTYIDLVKQGWFIEVRVFNRDNTYYIDGIYYKCKKYRVDIKVFNSVKDAYIFGISEIEKIQNKLL